MTDRRTGRDGGDRRRAWRNLALAFLALYFLMGVSLMVTGTSTADAWIRPLGLVAPALGMALVIRNRRPRA
ncbi:hypothetical protein KUF83_32780 [Streptomyces sp. BV286]|uniref:hypothetical protein n=1 Tax=unclassified Streptomyces TaxID=2593676 RepID=UPI001C2E590B|nr:hypothetical protein [Streptomyces sp. BV286]MBV1941300.1 hypothetical protein [Streptomyces sp. BV286]